MIYSITMKMFIDLTYKDYSLNMFISSSLITLLVPGTKIDSRIMCFKFLCELHHLLQNTDINKTTIIHCIYLP